MEINLYDDYKTSKELNIGDKVFFGRSHLSSFGEVLEIFDDSVKCKMTEQGCGIDWFEITIGKIENMYIITSELYEKWIEEEKAIDVWYDDLIKEKNDNY